MALPRPVPAGPADGRGFETIPVGEGPHGVTVSRDGSRVYVTCARTGSVTALEPTRRQVTAVHRVGTSVFGVAVSPDGERLYTADPVRSSVSVVAAASGAVTAETVFEERPFGLVVAPNGARLLVSAPRENAVLVTDGLGVPRGRLTGVDSAVGLALSPDGGLLYAANRFAGTVSVLDVSGLGSLAGGAPAVVLARIPVARGPYDLAVGPDGGRLYVAHYPFDLVSVVDTDERTVAGTFVVPDGPRGVAVSPDNAKLYVANGFAGTVTVVEL
ncbi:YncE family protein [Streptomyces sp. NRRL B-24484]|uniref:YncE family protein n=1 Tax=Streptomyces sp. NRRL B-24484 TaxID=1463833 RepID=UPI0004C02FF1|nr:YncE family protein [Streptomyces sp. NRRL B-24484]